MLAQRGNPTSGLLFLTERGKPLYPAWSFRLLKRLGRIASVPQAAQLSAHSMRSTAITELLRVLPLQDVQDFARHKDPRTTRRYDKSRANLDRAGSYVLAHQVRAAARWLSRSCRPLMATAIRCSTRPSPPPGPRPCADPGYRNDTG